MENLILYWGYIGIMKNKMGTTIVYWGYIGMRGNGNYCSISGSFLG